MPNSVIGQIAALKRMTVAELREEWERLYGEPARSHNKDYLWRRLAWRIQELAHGGLSERAKSRIKELVPGDLDLATTPEQTVTVANRGGSPTHRRDPRMPVPGSVITKTYKGRELRVTVREDGLELDGTMYPSATALAKAITGSKSINGWLFLGLTQRKRG